MSVFVILELSGLAKSLLCQSTTKAAFWIRGLDASDVDENLEKGDPSRAVHPTQWSGRGFGRYQYTAEQIRLDQERDRPCFATAVKQI